MAGNATMTAIGSGSGRRVREGRKGAKRARRVRDLTHRLLGEILPTSFLRAPHSANW
jgi:hypothetical protein